MTRAEAKAGEPALLPKSSTLRRDGGVKGNSGRWETMQGGERELGELRKSSRRRMHKRLEPGLSLVPSQEREPRELL